MELRNVCGEINISGNVFKGKHVHIIDNKVIIDGVTQDIELSTTINITVQGDVGRMENKHGKVTAQNVGSVTTQTGDVNCGNVDGSVRTMSGDIFCKKIGGSATTMSGNIHC